MSFTESYLRCFCVKWQWRTTWHMCHLLNPGRKSWNLDLSWNGSVDIILTSRLVGSLLGVVLGGKIHTSLIFTEKITIHELYGRMPILHKLRNILGRDWIFIFSKKNHIGWKKTLKSLKLFVISSIWHCFCWHTIEYISHAFLINPILAIFFRLVCFLSPNLKSIRHILYIFLITDGKIIF